MKISPHVLPTFHIKMPITTDTVPPRHLPLPVVKKTSQKQGIQPQLKSPRALHSTQHVTFTILEEVSFFRFVVGFF